MKIAIIGGSGFIGRNLTKVLQKKNHEIFIFSRKNNLPSELIGLENIQLVTSSAPIAKDLDGMDAVVNLAGEPIIGKRWTNEHMQELHASRVDFTRAVVSELEKVKKKPKVFLQGSAVGFYGLHQSAVPIFTESGNAGNDFLAKLSVDWETEALKATNLGIRTIILRTGIVLAKESGALEKMLLPFKMFVGGPIGNGEQYMSWIHISDMVESIQFLLNHPTANGAFNLTAPNPCSNENFSSCLGRVLGRPSILRVPEFALKALYGEGADILLKGQNVIPTKLVEAGYKFKFPEIELALKDLLQ